MQLHTLDLLSLPLSEKMILYYCGVTTHCLATLQPDSDWQNPREFYQGKNEFHWEQMYGCSQILHKKHFISEY